MHHLYVGCVVFILSLHILLYFISLCVLVLYFDYHVLEAVYSCTNLFCNLYQGTETILMSVWHFIRGLCTVHQQSQYIIDQLDQEYAAVPALCVRQWIRHCLLAHNLSTQIQALVSYQPYLLQHYFGMQTYIDYAVMNTFE